jgi:AAA domain-containing protein
MSATPLTPNVAEILRSINILFTVEQTIELRAFGTYKGSCTGFYHDRDKLAAHAAQISAHPDTPAIFWTLQDVNPELFGRAPDQFQSHIKSGVATKDADVQRYRWLLVDCDPLRNPAKTSSTDAEKADALEVATAVRGYFDGINAWDEGYASILADSGNGYHVLLRVDMEVSETSKALYQRVLQSLGQQFSTGDATSGTKIDTGVFNPSRICKVYGTPVRKGSETPERPHRMAQLLDVPDTLPIVPVDVLKKIAAEFTPATAATSAAHTPAASAMPSRITLETQALKMEQFLAEAKYMHRQRADYDNGGFKWQLTQCPFNAEHTAPDSYAFLKADGKMGFHCSHNHCVDNKWTQFRAKAEAVIGHRFQFVEPSAQPAQNSKEPKKSTDHQRKEVISILASDVVPVPIEFLWEPYLQMDALNAFYGNPSGGKGNTGIDIIARLSTGRPFPTETTTDRKPIRCVILAAEESAESTLVPRLMAAKADLKFVRIIRSIRYHEENDAIEDRLITFQTDMAEVRADLLQHPEEQYLFIDPITNYVGDINFNQDGEVRPVLTRLVQLGEELKITILIVGHFNKNTNVATALDKPGGGRAWTAIPRAVWGFFRHPENKQQRIMVNLKLNNAKETDTGLLFTIGDRAIGTKPNGKPWIMPYIEWGEKTDMSADEMVAAEQPEARRDSKGTDFLNETLKNGVRKATEVYTEATDLSIHERTLKRACSDIGVLKFKMHDGWFWQHPTDRTPIPEGARELNKEAKVRRETQKPAQLEEGPAPQDEPEPAFSFTDVRVG